MSDLPFKIHCYGCTYVNTNFVIKESTFVIDITIMATIGEETLYPVTFC